MCFIEFTTLFAFLVCVYLFISVSSVIFLCVSVEAVNKEVAYNLKCHERNQPPIHNDQRAKETKNTMAMVLPLQLGECHRNGYTQIDINANAKL